MRGRRARADEPRIGVLRSCVALVAAGLAAAAAADDAQPVRIGLVRAAAAGPLYIAVAAGYFWAEGLDPQVKFFETEAAVSAALVSSKLDIGFSGLSPRFFRAAAAHDLKMIASQATDRSGFPMYALLIGRKARAAGILGARQLAGARIGIANGEQGAYYALLRGVSRFGLAPESLHVVWLKSPGMELAAVASGNIDAALLPFSTTIQSAAKDDVLLRLGDLTDWQEGVVFAAAGEIASRRALVERFMRAYQRGAADYQLNFLLYDDAGEFIPGPHYGEYLELIASQARVPARVLQMAKTYCDRRANLDVADIRRQVNFWQERGELGRGIAPDALLDLSFIGVEPASQLSGPH